MRALSGLPRFRFRATPFTWLYRTLRHVCSEFNRRRPAETYEELPDESADTERAVEAAQLHRRVRELTAQLPPRQREVVLLRVFESLDVRTTANAMGCRPGTVKALLHQAQATLRERWA